MWVQILTACSGVWGARGGGLSGPRMLELESGSQHSLVDSKSEVLSRIAASKSTWSEVPGRDIHHAVSVPCLYELSVWEELKASAPRFFRDDWVNFLEPGRLIAEGGQAQIFEAKVEGFKIFKYNAERCLLFSGTLLNDGRFAFLMARYWGDLRTFIDLKVEDSTHPWDFNFLSQPLFSFRDSICIMKNIATGMQGLHAEGVLHRDLKAANVLIRTPGVDPTSCQVADYECTMFVQGTGFWRAPEVLQELQKNEEDQDDETWGWEVDVYSFGMSCYEILTGQIPFDGYTKSKWGDVIKGERPSLPNYIFRELRELVEACWHTRPSQRPPFDIILTKLDFLKMDVEFGMR